MGTVHQRIGELNQSIALIGGEGHHNSKALARRRYLLYQELWEMQHSTTSLQEYVDAVSERKKREDMLS